MPICNTTHPSVGSLTDSDLPMAPSLAECTSRPVALKCVRLCWSTCTFQTRTVLVGTAGARAVGWRCELCPPCSSSFAMLCVMFDHCALLQHASLLGHQIVFDVFRAIQTDNPLLRLLPPPLQIKLKSGSKHKAISGPALRPFLTCPRSFPPRCVSEVTALQ